MKERDEGVQEQTGGLAPAEAEAVREEAAAAYASSFEAEPASIESGKADGGAFAEGYRPVAVRSKGASLGQEPDSGPSSVSREGRIEALLPSGSAWEREWRRAAEAQYDQHMGEIGRELDQDILIALVGDVNAGKSSTLNRIVGEPVAGVGAEPGETAAIKPYLFKDRIFFVDTPGLNDVRLENSQLTMDYYRKADIILFFLNAAGTVYSEAEKRSFEAIRDANANIVVVLNKIDAADEVERIVERVRAETGGRFDIVPVSSRTGENIDRLRATILELLRKKSKDLLFARNLKEKSATANKWILGAAASAGAIGAAPIPGADIVPITAVQIGLLTRLAVLYGRPISKETARELVLATVVGNIGKSVFRQVVKLFPGAGSIAGASVAGAMTLALGYAVKYAYEHDMEISTATVTKLYGMFRKQQGAAGTAGT
ncbi:GTPase [Paenibacillus pasadenensis]|uniref:GTP-binding protein Era n=1 Tax=Paenibacillus pasadenensis TaxID=217090 RepID=A0A2N5ND03_9BACL|nr:MULTISPECIES: GTPase [Paenibacillus]PLT48212.1 GTP-binding protein Era [Paenibacillus pasadenensis]